MSVISLARDIPCLIPIGTNPVSVKSLGRYPCTIKALKQILSKACIHGLAYKIRSANRLSRPHALFALRDLTDDLTPSEHQVS